MRDDRGVIIGVITGDTGSLDYGSYGFSSGEVKRTPLMSVDNLGQYRLVPDVEYAADSKAYRRQREQFGSK